MSTYTLTFQPAGGSGVSLASGRKHLIFQDGSTAFDPLADYGPINSSALVSGGNMTIGSGTDGTDYTLTFDGHAGDGVITWMEDEDQFKISDDVMIVDDEKLIFGTGSDVTLEYDEDGTDTLLISGHATFADDKKLYFVTGKDAYIEYDEDGTDTWDF